MDNNSILKLSNKKSGGQKKKFTTKVKIDQGPLADSVTNKMMMNMDPEEQPSSLIQQSITNSKPSIEDNQNKPPSNKIQQNQSIDNDVNDSELKDKVPCESPLSQSRINEIIYGNNYANPAIQNELDIDKGIPDENMIDNVGMTAMDVNCPYCNTHVQSNVDSSWSCFTCFILLIMIIIFPLICVLSIYKAGRGSSRSCFCYSSEEDDTCTCCNDVKHVCPKCGKVIGESDSCSRLFSCVD
jgi:hypothetical protein